MAVPTRTAIFTQGSSVEDRFPTKLSPQLLSASKDTSKGNIFSNQQDADLSVSIAICMAS
jgi:hypothetical protein